MTNLSNSYRPEIDGLRAVAVLPVILFHAGVGLFSGGFLGVDVFFVISGYLITLILSKELGAGHFSVLNFYERRARRILPALFVVMLFTIPIAWAWMPPDALRIYFTSLPATAWFFSNVHFHFWQGYFSPDAELQPLLHTWSLAVEEQFYLVFPFVLAVLWKFTRRVEIWLAVFAVIGFGICLWQLDANPQAAFYLPHARFWELLAGAALAALHLSTTVVERFSPQIRVFMSIIAIIVLALCFVLIDETWSTPGFPNLLVVLATVTLLAFANKENPISKILSYPPLVGIGLISYSAYLWHHPLFAFARLGSLNHPSVFLMLGLALLSVLLAYISWRWVEKPFRQRHIVRRQTVFVAGSIMMLVLGVGGYSAERSNVAMSGYTAEQLALVRPAFSKAENCRWSKPVEAVAAITVCELGTESAVGPVVLWGDSHAAALRDELDAALAGAHRSGLYLGSSVCLRIPGIVPTSRREADDLENCKAIQTSMFTFLEDQKPSAIVINMRWTLRLFPVSGARDKVGFDNGEGGVESEDVRVNWAQDADGTWSVDDAPKISAIVSFLRRLTEIAPVIVVGPVPEVGWHVGDRNFKSIFINKAAPSDISTDFIRFSTRNAVALKALDQAEKLPDLSRIEPSRIFCNSFVPGRCAAQIDGKPFYADDDHVSAEGAALIIHEVMAKLPQQALPKP